jgi:hypothetical protein
MDFIVGLPKTPKGFDSIWVKVDRLTKSAHFIPMKTDWRAPHMHNYMLSELCAYTGYPRLLLQIGVHSLSPVG